MTEALEATTEPGHSRRSVVLRLMVQLANLYLIAFAGDTLVSVADDALRLVAGENPALHAARNLVGLVVLLPSVLMPFVLLFVPHLPKLPFLPPIMFTLLFLFATPFLPVAIEWLSVVQLLAAAASFLLLRARAGGWLLSAATLPRKRHLVARTVFATMVTVVTVPLTALLVGVLALVGVLEHETAGYLNVTASGIDVRESVLTKDGRTVRLMATAHYGEESFYRTLVEQIPAGSLILAEGVTDREQRLRAFPSALGIAKALGLTQQPGPSALRSRAAGAAPSHAVEGRPQTTGADSQPELVVADVDVADLSDAAVALLHDLADLYGGDSRIEALRRLLVHTRADPTLFKRELVDERNAHVLATFDDRAAAYRTIVIPWGALHMPGLEAGLRERGYRVDTQRDRTVVRFGAIAGSLIGLR